MAKFTIEKTKDYTVMSNYHLRDKNLSYKAKGLLSFMLSLPAEWDYSINVLVAISKEGVKAIRNILQELQQNGYLVIEKKQNKSFFSKPKVFMSKSLKQEYNDFNKENIDLLRKIDKYLKK